jgi:hypothetical protein
MGTQAICSGMSTERERRSSPIPLHSACTANATSGAVLVPIFLTPHASSMAKEDAIYQGVPSTARLCCLLFTCAQVQSAPMAARMHSPPA